MNNSESLFGHKLSARTYYNLLRHGIETKEQVLDAYINGKLLKLRNMGKVSHNEIFDWLDKEIDLKSKPARFVIKHTKSKPLTMPEKTLRSLGNIRSDILKLRSEISQIEYTLREWTKSNYDLHKSITVVGVERKYITNTQ